MDSDADTSIGGVVGASLSIEANSSSVIPFSTAANSVGVSLTISLLLSSGREFAPRRNENPHLEKHFVIVALDTRNHETRIQVIASMMLTDFTRSCAQQV